MKRHAVSHEPGTIVKIAGIDFVVLDNKMATNPDEPEHLFILAVNSQGSCPFGGSNNYAESNLRDEIVAWLESLEDKGVDMSLLMSRNISLLTMDGRGDFGNLGVLAAPLTVDEARKYGKLIPECDEATWMATGWGGPGMYGSAHAGSCYSDGDWSYNSCSGSYGVRPALVISSELLVSEEDDENDLSEISTDELLNELSRRIGS